MTSKYQVGERVIAPCVIWNKPRAFEILSVGRSILTCRDVEFPAENVEYKIKKSQVIGHSDL